MKKITIVALAAFMASFSSCSEDLLDQQPVNTMLYDGALTIKTEKDLASALQGMYSEFASADAFGADITLIGDLVSDNAFISQTNDGRFKITNQMTWTASTTNSDFKLYNKLYDAVSMANIIINSDIEQTDAVKGIVAQAYAARGLAYFYLATYYAANPTSGVNQEYGIAIHTGAYDPNAYYARTTVAETYEQIISDLEKGISPYNEVTENKGYLSATSARLLLAKAYLTRGAEGDYEKAIQYAEDAINLSQNSALISADQLQDYFGGTTSATTKDQAETVFEINMSVIANPGVNRALGSFFDPNGRKGYFMFRDNLVQLYKDGDARKYLFTQENADRGDAPNGHFLLKNLQVIDGTSYVGNVRVLRLTEAKFIKWEAMAKSGKGAEALQQVNEFATERGGSTYTGDALTAILEEKRKEFVGEGQRFIDLKRNNLGFEKGTNITGYVNSVPADSKFFVFPIPSSSINLNKLITQYPGWTN